MIPFDECRLSVDASAEIRDVVAALGRTEDVQFSPNNRRLALACFAASQIVILEISLDSARGSGRVEVLDYAVLTSPRLKYPHGVAFLDDETIVVANRRRYVNVFRLPTANLNGRTLQATPLCTIKGSLLRRIHSPGSAGVYRKSPEICDVLVCNNYKHVVTRHSLDFRSGCRIRNHGVLLRQGLVIPDGISISSDHQWIAVSNHGTGSVLIYANTPTTDRNSEPVGICHGIDCPHGLRFAGDDRYLFVAAAAARDVHLFESADGDWTGARKPVKTRSVLDEATFLRGRYNTEEGGPKGIDVDRSMKVLVATCEHQILAFFDLQKLFFESNSSALAAELVSEPAFQWSPDG